MVIKHFTIKRNKSTNNWLLNSNCKIMEEKSIEQFTKLVGDFRLLTTKVQKDNQIKSKIIKESNQVLESCKKEYENLHLEQ